MIDQRVTKFIKAHHVLTLATSVDNIAYCSNAFYAYDAERNLIVFTSDKATRHASEMVANPTVAASIVWETKLVGRIKGLQLTGRVCEADEKAQMTYLKKFPFTALAELTLWVIEPQFMKYTDNTLGFGKKIIWSAE